MSSARAPAAAGPLPLHLRIAPPATLRSRMPRPRSVQALLDLLQHNLALLRAPAGFGKTFLMTETREVLEKSGESTGWLTLREGYETEVGLLTELAAAMTGDGALEPSDHTNPEATIPRHHRRRVGQDGSLSRRLGMHVPISDHRGPVPTDPHETATADDRVGCPPEHPASHARGALDARRRRRTRLARTRVRDRGSSRDVAPKP